MFDNHDLHKFTWWWLHQAYCELDRCLFPLEIVTLSSHDVRIITGYLHEDVGPPATPVIDVIIQGMKGGDDWVINTVLYCDLGPTGRVTGNHISPSSIKLNGWEDSKHLRSLAMELKLQGILKGSYRV